VTELSFHSYAFVRNVTMMERPWKIIIQLSTLSYLVNGNDASDWLLKWRRSHFY
jgi:hypothetical protein